jgi:flavin reductase (DIM6/NTAB) family NADH-FMN oxidoreductase RutF
VLRQHAAGVTIVTVPGPAGFTATSFTSVSLEPALLSFCIGWSASTLPHVRAAEHFAVHLLSADGAELARRFARSGVDRFAGVDWSPTPEGVPRLQGTNGWLLARVVLRQRLGDHLQVVGEVQAVDSDTASPPLVHHNGAFTTARNL